MSRPRNGDRPEDDIYRGMWETVNGEWNYDASDHGVWDSLWQAPNDDPPNSYRSSHGLSFLTDRPTHPPADSPATLSHYITPRDPPPPPPVIDSGPSNTSAWFPTCPAWQLFTSRGDQHNSQHFDVPSGSARPPIASHREDWIDRSALEQHNDFRDHLSDHIFETLSQDDHTPGSSQQLTPVSGSAEPPLFSLEDLESDEDNEDEDEFIEFEMPSNPRRGRPTNVVDLTGGSSPPVETTQSRPHIRKRSAEAPSSSERPPKRKATSAKPIEEIDLANEAPSAEEGLLKAQQQDAIRAQQEADARNGPQRIGRRQCIICMESYTNATSTSCGHFYCHECLIQALIAGEKNSDRRVGNCPVCRKPINRKKQNQVIPISFMKKETFEKTQRKRLDVVG